MSLAAIIVFVYAVLVSLGGIMGFVKARSMPSLIAGEIGFLSLIAAGYGLYKGQTWGLPLAVILIAFLLVFFVIRYVRTRLFLPGGLMSILSLLALMGVLLTRPH